jgi:hypothetical protein
VEIWLMEIYFLAVIQFQIPVKLRLKMEIQCGGAKFRFETGRMIFQRFSKNQQMFHFHSSFDWNSKLNRPRLRTAPTILSSIPMQIKRSVLWRIALISLTRIG